MSKMKDSGIEWIGMIPEDWDINRLRYVCSLKTGGTPPDKIGINTDEKGVPWITAPDMDNSYKISTYSQYIDQEAIDLCNYELFPPKSILLVCIASVGKLGMIKDYCYSNQQITALMPNKKIIPEFLLYFIQSICHKIVEDASSSVVPIINSAYLKDIKVIMPSLTEQQLIANFLDDKVGKVNEILIDLNNQVEILQKYKKSVITQAVTKGLNPNVPMKDSGIDWIGEIPEGWDIKPLKYFTSIISKGATPENMSMVSDETYCYRFIKAENIQNGYLNNEPEFYIDKYANNALKRSILKPQDLLFVIAGATIGKVAIMRNELCPSNTNQAVCFIRLKEENANFYKYVLQSDIISNVIQLYTVQAAQPNLSMGNIANIRLPYIYDKNEQQQIADYLDNKCSKIDELIKDKEAQIEKMEKYKKSLIYEYVTGKKRVKGV